MVHFYWDDTCRLTPLIGKGGGLLMQRLCEKETQKHKDWEKRFGKPSGKRERELEQTRVQHSNRDMATSLRESGGTLNLELRIGRTKRPAHNLTVAL